MCRPVLTAPIAPPGAGERHSHRFYAFPKALSNAASVSDRPHLSRTNSENLVIKRKFRAAPSLALLTFSVAAFACGITQVVVEWLHSPGSGAEFALFAVVVSGLFYGQLVYQITRVGRFLRDPTSGSPASSDASQPPPVTVLVPSYKEERRVVLQTLLSAALARYPKKRIVLLLDDPPRGSVAELADLAATRYMVAALNARFAEQARRVLSHRRNAELSVQLQAGPDRLSEERRRLASLFEDAARFIEAEASCFGQGSTPAFQHGDLLFLSKVVGPVAAGLDECARALRARDPSRSELLRAYDTLAETFAVELSCFERKRYANLSHEPNKAMNLNSYIGLIGRNFATRDNGALKTLDLCCAEQADFSVPAATYVLTLDADSIITPDYISTLVRAMEADPDIAVAQTPYSAFPNAPNPLERAAGSTTDVQYFVHQGLTAFGATFWVGANALLRLSALHEIATVRIEHGHEVPIYIQDKTVIEDTGSTIDLISKGWRLHNHPERLAYSATPQNFGALVIQRRRWANGGLILFPPLLRARTQQRLALRVVEKLLRAHYLLSPAISSVALILLMFFPFEERYWSPWLIGAALPYYCAYGSDLREAGYRWSDLLCVSMLNMLLIPVNLAGVAASLAQAVTGRKSEFARTPKVDGRTATPALHILSHHLIAGASILGCVGHAAGGRWFYAAFSGANGALMLYAMVSFVGVHFMREDLRLALRAVLTQRVGDPVKAATPVTREPARIVDKRGNMERAEAA